MLFGAFPIVYREVRSWSETIGGCTFLGILVGKFSAVVYMIKDNSRYNKVAKRSEDGRATPEDCLPPALAASILISLGMFWFVWTNYASIRWIVSITAGGMVLVFTFIFKYLVDSYTIYRASVLAANTFLRSIFSTAFQLFPTQMYHNLGIHWASCIAAFLALICVLFPFIIYHYEARIKNKCNYSFIQHKS